MKKNLRNKTLSICILGMSLCKAFAGTMGDEVIHPYPYRGLYVGAFGGGHLLYGSYSQTANFQVVSLGASMANLVLTSNTTAARRSAVGGFLVGYDFLLAPRMLLGAEARVNFFNRSLINTASVTGTSGGLPISLVSTSTVKIKDEIDLLLKPGVIMGDGSSSIYLVGGAAYNQLKNTNAVAYRQTIDTGQGGIITFSGNQTLATTSSFQRDRWGGLLGIGAEQIMACGLGLRLEYDHVFYNRGTAVIRNTTLATSPDLGLSSGTLSSSTLLRLSGDRVTLGLTYHFA